MNTDIALIRNTQHASGAYPASPDFSQYPYCWLRDGSFIAYAMDRAKVHASARAFHLWAARAIQAQSSHIEQLIERAQKGEVIPQNAFLPARYTLEGQWKEDSWPNFQLDGYGQWLWSLGEHLRLSGEAGLPGLLAPAVDLTLGYLRQFWAEPCYDAWEENPSRLHTATLASIYGGMMAMVPYRPEALETAQAVRRVILEECTQGGRFVKFIGNPAVDASLLWVSTPFGVVGEDDPRMQATTAEIEHCLLWAGGLLRYASDTYYGGGAWLLLTAWLGWYYARLDNPERARECLAWVEGQRNAWGHLPEQVPVSSTNARFLAYWTRQWGSSACPLLWSHAMRLVLRAELSRTKC